MIDHAPDQLTMAVADRYRSEIDRYAGLRWSDLGGTAGR